VVPILVMGNVAGRVLRAIRWGLEEEGIPTAVDRVPTDAVNAIARQAAQMSKLNVGIAISQTQKRAVLHHRDLPEDDPLFHEDISRFDGAALRRLGANAARLVKGNPLLFTDEFTDRPQKDLTAPGLNSEALSHLVAQVVRDILSQTETKLK